MKRADILQTAEKCVCGKREQDYGKPENNFQAIADLWNAYLKHAYNSTPLPDFTAFDVAMLMALLKVGRIATGTATEDSFVDACGYLACGGEIASKTNPIEREEQQKANVGTNDNPNYIPKCAIKRDDRYGVDGCRID